MQITIRVPGVPVAQPRVKATIRGAHAGVYTPTTKGTGDNKRSNGVAEYKASIRHEIAAVFTGPLMAGPVKIDVELVFPRQKHKVWATKPMPRYRHVTKPDADNVLKLVKDALKGVLWEDDNQVCSVIVEKWHCSGAESPHCFLRVTELEAGE